MRIDGSDERMLSLSSVRDPTIAKTAGLGWLDHFDRRFALRLLAVIGVLPLYYAFDWHLLQAASQKFFTLGLTLIGDAPQSSISGPLLISLNAKFFGFNAHCTYFDLWLVLSPLVWRFSLPLRSNLLRLAILALIIAGLNTVRVVTAIHLYAIHDMSWNLVHYVPDLVLHLLIITAVSLRTLWVDWWQTSRG